MRDKEAIENERKNLVRNLEKQSKVVEKLMAADHSMQDQLVCHSTCFYRVVSAEMILERA